MSHWRVAALGSASLVVLLGLTFAVSVVRANLTPDTVVTAGPDEPLAVLPKVEAAAPSDAEIAYILAGFVTNVRSLSVDPVIVRANWIDALDHVTARGARMLNAYARDESPFTKIGRRNVTVVVTKVVRTAEDTFEIHWEEQILETGAPVRRERFSGAVSILFGSPSTAKLISKNPLGLYVDSFTWRRDSIRDATERFVCRQNIINFTDKLAAERDLRRRAYLRELLVQQEDKLARDAEHLSLVNGASTLFAK